MVTKDFFSGCLWLGVHRSNCTWTKRGVGKSVRQSTHGDCGGGNFLSPLPKSFSPEGLGGGGGGIEIHIVTV